MKMQKSSPEMEATFERAFPTDARAERRKMFGYPSGFINGNHFGGLFGDDVCLRLSEADRKALAEQGGQQLMMPTGRPMTGYMLAPRAIVDNPEQLRAWLERALEHAASLPAKQAKTKKAAAAKKAR